MYKVFLIAALTALTFGCAGQQAKPKEVIVKKWTAMISCNYDSSHSGRHTVYGITADDARRQARRIAQKHTDETTHPAEVSWVKDEGPAPKE